MRPAPPPLDFLAISSTGAYGTRSKKPIMTTPTVKRFHPTGNVITATCFFGVRLAKVRVGTPVLYLKEDWRCCFGEVEAFEYRSIPGQGRQGTRVTFVVDFGTLYALDILKVERPFRRYYRHEVVLAAVERATALDPRLPPERNPSTPMQTDKAPTHDE